MRIVFGRAGFVGSLGGRRIADRHPGWDLVDATGAEWRRALQVADVAVPFASSVEADDLQGAAVRLVHQFGTGLDTVDVAACTAHGIAVAHVPSAASPNAASVGELAALLVLALIRRLDDQREGARTGELPAPARRVEGRRVVLLGLGGVGAAVAARLAPFGVELRAVRAHPERGSAPGVASVQGPDALHALLADADGVVCCVPGGSGPLLDEAAFAALRRGAFVVNVARGDVLDERALLSALNDGRVSGAGLDVLVHDPARPDDPLVQHPRVIVTPHVAGSTVESVEGIADALLENLARFERGDALRWQVG